MNRTIVKFAIQSCTLLIAVPVFTYGVRIYFDIELSLPAIIVGLGAAFIGILPFRRIVYNVLLIVLYIISGWFWQISDDPMFATLGAALIGFWILINFGLGLVAVLITRMIENLRKGDTDSTEERIVQPAALQTQEQPPDNPLPMQTTPFSPQSSELVSLKTKIKLSARFFVYAIMLLLPLGIANGYNVRYGTPRDIMC